MSTPSTKSASTASPVRAIAYYLPQFHPVPENDAWWGKGFTEWTNVVRARPLFEGHDQPQLPTELGFYDLRLPEVRAAQAELARQYGIHGFCYYYYSFGSKRLLERPLLDMLESGVPDFPFCICWANESWSRRWDGSEAETLVAQDDSPEAYRRFIHEVLPILQDRRYVRVEGKPVLLVYRVGRIPDAQSIAASWRESAVAAGLPGLYLCAVQSHDPSLDPRLHGFDAAVEFPPAPWHGTVLDPKTLPGLDPDFTGRVFDYVDAAARTVAREAPPYRLLRGVMTAWDNTARRGPAAYLFRNSTPREYEGWLRAAAAWTQAHNPPDERIVFVNAWNEWAEGAHLEPDARHGRAWLEATRSALSRADAWRGAIEALRRGAAADPAALAVHLDDLEHALARLDVIERGEPVDRIALSSGVPAPVGERPVSSDGLVRIDRLQGEAARGRVALRRGDALHVTGWAIAPGMDLRRALGLLVLRSPTGARVFSAPLNRRTPRDDVAFQHRRAAAGWPLPGFDVRLDTSAVEPGEYKVAVLHADGERVVGAFSEQRVVVA